MAHVAESPETRSSLLVRLRDHRDAEAWCEFVELYAPLIYAHARRRGLQDADAADATQEVFRQVARTMADFDYDARRGRFRNWLLRITENEVRDVSARRRRAGAGTGDTAVHDLLAEQPAAAADEETWEQEFRKRLLERGYEQVKARCDEKTWRAFWLTAIDGRSGREAADELGMSPGAVYMAKSRIIVRLRAPNTTRS